MYSVSGVDQFVNIGPWWYGGHFCQKIRKKSGKKIIPKRNNLKKKRKKPGGGSKYETIKIMHKMWGFSLIKLSHVKFTRSIHTHVLIDC